MARGFRHLPEKISSGPRTSCSRQIPIDRDPHPSWLLGILCPFLPASMITAEGDRNVVVICSPIAPQKLAVIISLVTVFAPEHIAGARDLGYPHPQPLIGVLGVDHKSGHKVIPLGRDVRIASADNRRAPFLAPTVFMEIDVAGGRGDSIRQDQVPAVEVALHRIEDIAPPQILAHSLLSRSTIAFRAGKSLMLPRLSNTRCLSTNSFRSFKTPLIYLLWR